MQPNLDKGNLIEKQSHNAFYKANLSYLAHIDYFFIFILYRFANLCKLWFGIRGGYDLWIRYGVGKMSKYCIFLGGSYDVYLA